MIRNKDTRARVIDATGDEVAPGDTIELDPLLEASLCEQVDVWEPVGAQGPPATEKPKRGKPADAPEGPSEEDG